MFDAWKKKKRAETEAAQLAAFRARDAEVGVPTVATLRDRMAVAARSGQWSIVDDCVQKGCSYNDTIQIGRSKREGSYCAPYEALPHEVYNGHYYPDAPMLVLAIMFKDEAAAAHMVAQGANVNAPLSGRHEDISPLALAVNCGMAQTVKMLCDNGADLAGDDRPLRDAEKRNQLDIIKIIRAEEEKRAQAAPAAADDTLLERRAILEAVDQLSPAGREKLMMTLRDKFPAPEAPPPAQTELSQDMQVLKPLSLKKQAQPS